MTEILLIDDSEFDRNLVLKLLSGESGWNATACRSGEEALDVLARETFDLVITDLRMPGIDGLEVIREIQRLFPALPVILITSHGNEDIALQALQQGAASYIPKRAVVARLVDSANTVLSASQQQKKRGAAIRYIESQHATLKLPNDRSLVPGVVAWMQDLATEHGIVKSQDAVRIGVALEEALLNAMIHGNLEVSSELREQEDGALYDEFIELHSAQEPFCSRKVTATVTLDSESVCFQIADEGPGFDVSALPDPTDPENLLRSSGRGLLLIQAFMDEVEFNAKGNCISMMLRRDDTAAAASVSSGAAEPAFSC